MKEKFKKFARRNYIIRKSYRTLKTAVLFPLQFTSYNSIPLHNFQLKDLFNPSKTSLLKIVSPYTKAGYQRLTNIYDLSIDIEKRNLSGAFVECGTWKGGCAGVMAAIAERFGGRRKTWFVDSFEGMPPPTKEDGERTERIAGDVLKASIMDVEELIFTKLHLPKENSIIVKGWFENVLPKIKSNIGPITILRLDADWYSSTKTCLNELYDQVISGGYVIFDDYGSWPGCRQAVHEFLDNRKLKPTFMYIGTYDPEVYKKLPPMYFQKP